MVRDEIDRACRHCVRVDGAQWDEAQQEMLIALWGMYRSRGWAFSLDRAVEPHQRGLVITTLRGAIIDMRRRKTREKKRAVVDVDRVVAAAGDDTPLMALLCKDLADRVMQTLPENDRWLFIRMIGGKAIAAPIGGRSPKTLQRARRRIEAAVLAAVSA